MLSKQVIDLLGKIQNTLCVSTNSFQLAYASAYGCKASCSGDCEDSCAGGCEDSCAGSCDDFCAGSCENSIGYSVD